MSEWERICIDEDPDWIEYHRVPDTGPRRCIKVWSGGGGISVVVEFASGARYRFYPDVSTIDEAMAWCDRKWPKDA